MGEQMTCSAKMVVELDGVEKNVVQWALERGLKWETVRKRRYRGDNWGEALKKGLRRSSFND